MNFDIKKLLPYILTAMITLFIAWLLWRNNDDDDNSLSGRNYEKEYKQSVEEVNRLRKDSLELRQMMQEEIAESERKYLDERIKLRQLEKHYEKLDFKNHSAPELDSIRDRILSRLKEY